MKIILTLLMMSIYITGYTQIILEEPSNYVLTKTEVLDLNSLFEKKRKNFDFHGKKIGYSIGTSGTQLENKAVFFEKYLKPAIDGTERNPCALIIFTEEEKNKSGGFDAVIMAPAKIFIKKHRKMLVNNLAKMILSN